VHARSPAGQSTRAARARWVPTWCAAATASGARGLLWAGGAHLARGSHLLVVSRAVPRERPPVRGQCPSKSGNSRRPVQEHALRGDHQRTTSVSRTRTSSTTGYGLSHSPWQRGVPGRAAHCADGCRVCSSSSDTEPECGAVAHSLSQNHRPVERRAPAINAEKEPAISSQ
jgi:hypothetical protein